MTLTCKKEWEVVDPDPGEFLEVYEDYKIAFLSPIVSSELENKIQLLQYLTNDRERLLNEMLKIVQCLQAGARDGK